MTAKVDLQSNANITYTNNATMSATATPYVSVTYRGDTLNAMATTSGTQKSLLWALTQSDLSSVKMGLFRYAGLGTPFLAVLHNDSSSWTLMTTFSGVDFGSFDNARYYEIRLSQDATNNPANVPIYIGAYDDTATLCSQWYNGTTTPTIGTTTGQGCLLLGNPLTVLGGGYSYIAQEYVVESAKMGTDGTFAAFNSPLEEGSGSSVSPGGTIAGTYSWIVPSAPPMRFFRMQTTGRRRK